jgi:oxygen-independent coproporphyrinogen III oxidase
MAGIYLHIPFCKKACHYCNFHFSTSLQLKNGFVQALLKEIALREDYLQGETVHTIYFGGGTPSLLNKEELLAVTQSLRSHFPVAADAELTLESNPDDITVEKLEHWKEAGINRLSIGVQSFFEEDLLWMNRAHNASQAVHCIELARQAGFNNLTIDLIYGSPTLTDQKWKENIDTAVSLGISHLSCYALTVEQGTALQKMIALHKKEDVDNDRQASQFTQLMDSLSTAGYEHYEISNFAKPGYRSRHNSSYWQGKKYLGLGPSAHSFNGSGRQWNIANNTLYIQSLAENKVPLEEEKLTTTQHLNEYIMTALRTLEGIDLLVVEEKFGKDARESVVQSTGKWLAKKLCLLDSGRIVLTKEGKLFADGIASDLFVTGS